jgi:small subunit ribosomal protein S5
VVLLDRLVSVNRVTKVTKGGRAFGFPIVVVGDENGTDYGLNLKMFLRQSRKQWMLKKFSKNSFEQSVPHEQKR